VAHLLTQGVELAPQVGALSGLLLGKHFLDTDPDPLDLFVEALPGPLGGI
jgi:hypothetical protein